MKSFVASPIQNNVEPETIYYDIVMPYNPDESGFSPAVFQQQLSQPIVHDPQDYFLAIVRFSIPGETIPIFIPDIQSYPNTDLLKTIYSFTLEYNGGYSPEVFVEFISQFPSAQQSLPLTSSHPFADKTQYYYIYNYQPFLAMCNIALSVAFSLLPTTPSGLDPPVAPYFIYDPNTLRISLIAQQAYYDLSDSSITPIKIYYNTPLYRFFDGLANIGIGVNTVNGRDIQLNVINNNNTNWYYPSGPSPSPPTTLTLLRMEQEYNTLSNWNSLKTIQLVSNLLPINREYIPPYTVLNAGVVNAQGILADFVPLISLGPEARNSIEFVANGPWRLIDMFGRKSISQVDITVYWVDEEGNRFVLDIPYGRVITVKIVFIKKDILSIK